MKLILENWTNRIIQIKISLQIDLIRLSTLDIIIDMIASQEKTFLVLSYYNENKRSNRNIDRFNTYCTNNTRHDNKYDYWNGNNIDHNLHQHNSINRNDCNHIYSSR